MAKVIDFRKRAKARQKVASHTVELLIIADEIDKVILRYIGQDIDPKEMSGLLAHRLGTLRRHVSEDDRKILWLVVKKVLQEQADLGKVP